MVARAARINPGVSGSVERLVPEGAHMAGDRHRATRPGEQAHNLLHNATQAAPTTVETRAVCMHRNDARDREAR
jgi:hypothetical protein